MNYILKSINKSTFKTEPKNLIKLYVDELKNWLRWTYLCPSPLQSRRRRRRLPSVEVWRWPEIQVWALWWLTTLLLCLGLPRLPSVWCHWLPLRSRAFLRGACRLHSHHTHESNDRLWWNFPDLSSVGIHLCSPISWTARFRSHHRLAHILKIFDALLSSS